MGVPIPPIEMFQIMVDVLATRYGWPYREISEQMYWENVYEMFEYASNMNAIEKNEQMKFDFMLHATKEAVDQWEDILIPYPDRNWQPPAPIAPRYSKVFRDKVKQERGTSEDRKRFEEVLERVKETRKKAHEMKKAQMYGRYHNS